MSRWKPAAPKASAYVTAEGLTRLREEYEQLWRGRRPEVVRALAAAAAEGDRSENAEYQYRKKELREIDRRVRYLQRRLAELRVPPSPKDRSRVYFGATVLVEYASGEQRELRLVGPDEVDASAGRISIDAPLARALIGLSEGDAREVALPDGSQEVTVLRLCYKER